jgi:putative ABC transport system substrate-binding protein
MERVRVTGARLGIDAVFASMRQPDDVEPALADIAHRHPEGLIVPDDPFLQSQQDRIIAFAGEHRLPAIYGLSAFVEAGGLMSYSASIFNVWRHGASYVDRILKGTKPSDLPIEQPAKFTLRINLKAASAIGLTVPLSLLARADEVIE